VGLHRHGCLVGGSVAAPKIRSTLVLLGLNLPAPDCVCWESGNRLWPHHYTLRGLTEGLWVAKPLCHGSAGFVCKKPLWRIYTQR
jgi:hypothetical protein